MSDARTRERPSPVWEILTRPRLVHHTHVERKLAVVVVLIALLLGTMLLAASAQNEYCLPWQERVGHGDGVLGPDDDYTTCR
jgi:hypothetical protein